MTVPISERIEDYPSYMRPAVTILLGQLRHHRARLANAVGGKPSTMNDIRRTIGQTEHELREILTAARGG